MKSWQRFAEVFLFNFYSHKFCIWGQKNISTVNHCETYAKWERYWKIRQIQHKCVSGRLYTYDTTLVRITKFFWKTKLSVERAFRTQIYTYAPSTQSSLFRNIWLCPDLLKWIFGTNWSAIVSSPLFATNRCQNFSFNTFFLWCLAPALIYSIFVQSIHSPWEGTVSPLFVSFVLLCRCKYNLNSNLSRTITSISVWCSVSITMHIIQLIPSKRVSLLFVWDKPILE